jgi:hypothetical protein
LKFELSTGALESEIELEVSAGNGFVSEDDRFAFYREKSGSEVGAIEIEDWQLIGESATGNRLKKLGKVVLAAGTIAAAYYSLNAPCSGWVCVSAPYYSIYLPPPVNTQMLADLTHENLYVINTQTGDVTVLGLTDFDRVRVESVRGAFLVIQLENSPYITLMGLGEIAFINPATTQPEKRHDNGSLVGLDTTNQTAFMVSEDNLIEINLRNGNSRSGPNPVDDILFLWVPP